MRIGYACLTAGVPDTKFKSCIMKNATPERLYTLIEHNLESLKVILEYNAKNSIRLFRISSDLIPFGSSPVNNLKWWEIFSDKFSELADFIAVNDIRISMHPGQYTVLNSPNPDVVSRAVNDLIYHLKLLEALGSRQSSKIVLHLGGVYGDKTSALERLVQVYNSLDSGLKKRIIFENDDKAYNICDVLGVSDRLGTPVVYDNLHYDVNPCECRPHEYWIRQAAQTWKASDGTPKIHYSQQAAGRPKGAHSQTIAAQQFAEFINQIGTGSDIMLEVKDKNISAVKCINILSEDTKALERDWQRYKYKMLELSPSDFNAANDMMSCVNPDAISFYSIAEHAFEQPQTSKNILSTAKIVWEEYFSMAEKSENDMFYYICKDFSGKKREVTQLKKHIANAAQKYEIYALLNSFYLNLIT